MEYSFHLIALEWLKGSNCFTVFRTGYLCSLLYYVTTQDFWAFTSGRLWSIEELIKRSSAGRGGCCYYIGCSIFPDVFAVLLHKPVCTCDISSGWFDAGGRSVLQFKAGAARRRQYIAHLRRRQPSSSSRSARYLSSTLHV